LFDCLRDLQKKHSSIREVRGMGLMGGLELESADLAKDVFKQLLERGVIVNRTDETVIRLLPPFIIKKQHVDHLVRQLDAALSRNTVELATTVQRRHK